MGTKYGIDVCSYQGTIDWAKCKKAGLKFAILKCIMKGLGEDKKFAANVKGCKAQKIPFDCYTYVYENTTSGAKKRADAAVSALKSNSVTDCTIWWDVEDSSIRKTTSAAKASLTASIQAAQKIIEAAGYGFGIYCDADFYKSCLNADKLDCRFWLAKYGKNPATKFGTAPSGTKPTAGKHEVCGWQYCSKGKISGISGNVDLDIAYDNHFGTTGDDEDAKSDATYYRVRKSWADSSSQLGAFTETELENAKKLVDQNSGYYVYDESGKQVYPEVYDGFYRVRKSYADLDSQLGAFTVLDNAKKCADANSGYHVYDDDGICLYPLPYSVQLVKDTAYYKAADGKTVAGTAAAGVYTITAVSGSYGKLKSGVGWLYLGGLDAVTVNSNIVTVSGSKVTLNGRTLTVWNQHKLSGTYKSQLSSSGCGICTCAMAAVLAGVDTTPEKVVALAVKKWGKAPDNHWCISGQGMETLLKSYGVSSDYKLVTEDNLIKTKAIIKAALKAGHPVACWTDDNGLDSDPFASGNHWVLAVGYNADGKIVVANSGNKGSVNLVTLDTLTKFLYAKCAGGATGWYTHVKNSAGIVVLE